MIRPAIAADLPAMMALASEAGAAPQWSKDQYHAIFSLRRVAFVSGDRGAIDGFVVATAASPEWELESIVVAAAMQRRGLATQLLDQLIAAARARHASAIVLEVRQSNSPASRFYEKCGFLQIGQRPGYYRAPAEPALIYQLKF